MSEAALAALLSNLSFEISDLPGANLAAALTGGRIIVDNNGAGHGWFVDATPGEEREFSRVVSASERRAIGGSSAYGYVDLLTVLEHEIGHMLGLEHGTQSDNIMAETLSLSTRRVPTTLDAALVNLAFAAWQRERERR